MRSWSCSGSGLGPRGDPVGNVALGFGEVLEPDDVDVLVPVALHRRDDRPGLVQMHERQRGPRLGGVVTPERLGFGLVRTRFRVEPETVEANEQSARPKQCAPVGQGAIRLTQGPEKVPVRDHVEAARLERGATASSEWK